MNGGERWYRRLVRLALRDLSADERAEVVSVYADLRRLPKYRGILGTTRLWLRLLADLAVAGGAGRGHRLARGVGEIGRDVRHALRVLARTPTSSAAAILTLALGIGGTTAMFSVVDGVLLSPLPYPEADRLVSVRERTAGGQEVSTSWLNFQDWRAGARSLDALAAYTSARGATVITADGGAWARVASVSADFFDVVGTEPLLGRTFGGDENRPGGPPVAVVSESFWRDVLGAPAPLHATTLNEGGVTYDVVGVLPETVDVPDATDVWLPLGRSVPWTVRGNHVVFVLGRMAPEATLAAVRGELVAAHERIREAYPEVESPTVAVRPWRDMVVGGASRPLALLLIASTVLMLVACTNVASTLLARGLARRREIAVRASLGAGRGRLVRQLLVESGVLALAGGAGALVVAHGILVVARATDPGAVPRLAEVELDGSVFAFTTAAALTTALVFGLWPTLQLTRGNLAGDLRGGRSADMDRRIRRSWNALMAGEVALALVLLVGAGLTGRSFMAILQSDNGIRTEGVVTGRIQLPSAEYRTFEQGVAFIDALLDDLRASPGVDAAGLALLLPVEGEGAVATPVELPDGRRTEGVFQYRVADAGLFQTLDIPLVRGRLFDEGDRPGAPHVAVVDEVLAARLWPGEDPIGKRFNPRGMDPWPDEWLTVVGVVREVRTWTQQPGTNPTFYVSMRQRPAFVALFGASLLVRGSDEAAMAALLRERVRMHDADVPVRVATLRSRIADSAGVRRFIGAVMGAFATVALLLAALGVYAVVGYGVAQRTPEIGIRLALGAAPGQVRGNVLRKALTVAGLGVGAGLAAALALSRAAGDALVGVAPLDPTAWIAATAIMLGVAAIASWVPARRATRVDPASTLASS